MPRGTSSPHQRKQEPMRFRWRRACWEGGGPTEHAVSLQIQERLEQQAALVRLPPQAAEMLVRPAHPARGQMRCARCCRSSAIVAAKGSAKAGSPGREAAGGGHACVAAGGRRSQARWTLAGSGGAPARILAGAGDLGRPSFAQAKRPMKGQGPDCQNRTRASARSVPCVLATMPDRLSSKSGKRLSQHGSALPPPRLDGNRRQRRATGPITKQG